MLNNAEEQIELARAACDLHYEQSEQLRARVLSGDVGVWYAYTKSVSLAAEAAERYAALLRVVGGLEKGDGR